MAAPIADIVAEHQLRDSYRKHATLAQLNRMWQYQECRASGVANLLDMMAEDVVVHSPHLDVRGHTAMREALAQIPLDWQAAHVLEGWQIAVDGDETKLTAKLAYLTAGADTTSRAKATYVASFVAADGVLPKLARIDVVQGDAVPTTEAFVDRFVEHRVLSLVHYFFALVENPARDAKPFFELLAEDFTLHYTDLPITGGDALRAWVAGALSSVIASEHVLHQVAVTDGGDGRYAAEVTMKSQAMFPDKSGAISRNKQRWTMIDTAGERFPRIVEIDIERDSVVRFDAKGRQTG